MKARFVTPVATLVLVAAAQSAAGADPTVRNAYFGDVHLHTAYSFDAYIMGDNLLPEDAYRYARGEELEYAGKRVKRKAALDFLAVTDHAEYLGVNRQIGDPKGPYAGTEWPKRMAKPAFDDMIAASKAIRELADTFAPGLGIPEFLQEDRVRDNWQRVIEAAEKYYQPGKFTTFVAYEWTTMEKRANLHRNVIFRGPKYVERPFSAIDSKRPEDLWAFIDHNRRNGVDALAISHNANLSDGLMYQYVDSDGKPITREYADRRNGSEPLVEVAQHKATSETHPGLSPNDEFAGFELIKTCWARPECPPDGSYARQAYGRGLEIATKIGANPYKFGLVGGSDSHNALSGTEEGGYLGAGLVNDTNPRAVLTPAQGGGDGLTVWSAQGLTGVWAEQNTREAIFDALKRKEVFATSGGRVKVRFFAGWHYPADLLRRNDWVRLAYDKGVPMGADLPSGSAGDRSPRFAVQAVKDPDGGNLDRIQIVKVWNRDGESHEKVFDVAWSGKRKPDTKTGKLPAVGNTVDLNTATYSNSIGATQLTAVWQDPEFDARTAATYYVRVLEIPTPRWTTYWAVRSKLPLPTNVPATIQERAWTSPIFYNAS